MHTGFMARGRKDKDGKNRTLPAGNPAAPGRLPLYPFALCGGIGPAIGDKIRGGSGIGGNRRDTTRYHEGYPAGSAVEIYGAVWYNINIC